MSNEILSFQNVLAVVLAAIGLLGAYAWGRNVRKRTLLRQAYGHTQIIGMQRSFGPGVSIAVSGKQLDKLSKTEVAFWHARGDAIRRTDTVVGDPLRVEVLDGDEMLAARIVSRSREANRVTVSVVDGVALIDFDFLDTFDGAVIEVLHSGAEPARLVGTIPGVTVAEPTRALLGADSRMKVRASVRSRFGQTFSGNWSLAFTLLLTAGVSMFLGALAIWLSLAITGSQNVVVPGAYDLQQPAEQVRFAWDVFASGGVPGVFQGATIVAALFFILTAVGGANVVGSQVRATVPRSVVREELDPFT